MAGRRSKQTPEREARVLEALRAGNTRKAACAYAGIDLHTLARWSQNATFASAIEKAEGDAEVRAVAQIAKAAQDGTWTAAAWWLERRYPEVYGRRFEPDQVLAAAAVQVSIAFDRADANSSTLALPATDAD